MAKTEDILKTKSLSKTIAKVIKDRDNVNLALFANWGQGKSTIMEYLEEELSKKNFNFFTFDVWNYASGDFRKMFLYKLGAFVSEIDLKDVKLYSESPQEYFDWFFSTIVNSESRDITKEYKKSDWVKFLLPVAASIIMIAVGATEKIEALWSSGIALLALDSGFFPKKINTKEPKKITTHPSNTHEDFIIIFESIISKIKSGKVVVVLENIDRLDIEEVKLVLDSVKTFIDKSENKIALVAPIDYRTIKMAYGRKAQQTIDKIFTDTLAIPFFDKTNVYKLTKKKIEDEIKSEHSLGKFLKGKDYSLDLTQTIFPIDPRAIEAIIRKMDNILNLYRISGIYKNITLRELERHAILEYFFPNIRVEMERNPHFLDVLDEKDYSLDQRNAIRTIGIKSIEMVSELNNFTTTDSKIQYSRSVVKAIVNNNIEVLTSETISFSVFKDMYKKENWKNLNETKVNILKSLLLIDDAKWDDKVVLDMLKFPIKNGQTMPYKEISEKLPKNYLLNMIDEGTSPETMDQLNFIEGYLNNIPDEYLPEVEPIHESDKKNFYLLRKMESANDFSMAIKYGIKLSISDFTNFGFSTSYIQNYNYVNYLKNEFAAKGFSFENDGRVLHYIFNNLMNGTAYNQISYIRSNMPEIKEITDEFIERIIEENNQSMYSYIGFVSQRMTNEQKRKYTFDFITHFRYESYHGYYAEAVLINREFINGLGKDDLFNNWSKIFAGKNTLEIIDLTFEVKEIPANQRNACINQLTKEIGRPKWITAKEFRELFKKQKEESS